MTYNLKNRNFLKLLDFSPSEIGWLLDLSRELKVAKYAGTEQQRLKGKNIVLIFEKASTRTRCAFEVAAFDQGANVTYLSPTAEQLGAKESKKDIARVLARMYDAIEYGGFDQETAEELGHHGVPVWNGLTNKYHPTQVLADLLTIKEHSQRPLHETSLCFIGNGKSNMGDSLMVGAAKMGMDFRMASPKAYQPDPALVERCREVAHETGARLALSEDIPISVKHADFVYTDVWLSLGDWDTDWAERIEVLSPYQVSRETMDLADNPRIKLMHCLPAFHNRESDIGQEIHRKYGLDAMEVTDDVFESSASVVFDQAENRLHTIKAVMVATLGG